MKRFILAAIVILTLLLISCGKKSPTRANEPSTIVKGDYDAPFAQTAPTVDGIADEAVWEKAAWADIDELWLGSAPTADDFHGHFKIVWTHEKLYLLVELTDNMLVDKYRDPLQNYWDDDCLEVFLDEDRSKGDHTYNYNAFAYHISYELHAVDMGTDQQPHVFDDHVKAKWTKAGSEVTWELAINIYDDSFDYNAASAPVALGEGKVMGFMLAYCDADGSVGRESFIGSIPIVGPDKNLGWRDAGVFGKLSLVK